MKTKFGTKETGRVMDGWREVAQRKKKKQGMKQGKTLDWGKRPEAILKGRRGKKLEERKN